VVTDKLLRAAAARAGGQLQSLDVSADATADERHAARMLPVARIGARFGAPDWRRRAGGAGHTWLANVWQHNVLLDVPAAVALGNALRASSTLTALSLRAFNLWREPAAATALIGALLAGHSRLQSLNVSGNQVDEASRDRAGAWIAALLAANAPALLELDVGGCSLLDAGLRPLLEALPANTHLRTLDCSGNWLTDDCMRDALLPAVRVSSSLRELKTGLLCEAAFEAETLVQGRAADEAARANPSRGSERAARAELSRLRANQQMQRSALRSSELLFAALERLRT
jgi:hypothetical protein